MGVVLNAPFPRQRRLGNAVRNVFRYLFVGAARNWFRNLSATAPALGSMTLLLLLTGLVGLSVYTLERVAASQATDAALLHVYLRDDVSQADVDGLRSRLSADPRVVSVGYTSKQDALRLAQRRPGLPDLAGAADSNPFPASFDVRLRSVRDVEALAGDLSQTSGIDPALPTSYNPGTYDRIQRVLTMLGVVGGGFLLVLGFVATTVTANSIRAAIFSRRQELTIMQLVGAPRWMVRGPFLVEGALTGGAAGLIAALATLVVGVVGVAAGSTGFAQLAPGVTLGVCALVAGLVFLAGLLLGSAASLLSVHRQLESA